MIGRCHYCKNPTETVRGALPRLKRPKPRDGWRLGFVQESSEGGWLICLPCILFLETEPVAA